jgi:hypothetical protein
VASSTGGDEPQPVSVPRLAPATTSPTTNNLERVSGVKPLRSIAGSPPAGKQAQP